MSDGSRTHASEATVRIIEGAVWRATGHRYAIKWDKLDEKSAREIVRLLSDLEYEGRLKARKAQLQFWRRA